MSPSGWIILDKPLGLGSTQAVAAVKRNLRGAGFGKGIKVGHGGTLDPLATGVLPIALGEATKLCGRMLDASKAYAFTVQFGCETDTLDLEGRVIAESPVRPMLAELEAVLPRFTGPIEQIPPAFSAIKVDGARAYDLARAGEEVVLKARVVTIDQLAIRHAELVSASIPPSAPLSPEKGWTLKQVQGDQQVGSGGHGQRRAAGIDGGGEPLQAITLLAHVSKGTYIRSLARDIALALGTVGHVTMLRRLKAGPFTVDQAISLDKLNEVGKGAPLENVLLPLEAGLVDIPALDLGPEQARAVRQGRVLTGLPHDDGLYWARAGTRPIALVDLSGGSLIVSRGFNLPDVAE